MSGPLRAAVYVRKSTTHGLDSEYSSLDNQVDSCRAYIRARGWTELPTLYSDGGFSGGTVDRPAFQRLLADVDAGKLDAIVVHRLDRFSRSVADFARLLEDMKRRGVAVTSVTEGFDTSTAAGTLMVNLIISMAQWEREAASERLKTKFANARRRGLYTGGRPPFGYRVEQQRLVVEPAEAEVLRAAFAALARGDGFTAAAQQLNARGWTTREGRAWTRQRLEKMACNRVYLGQLRAGDEWVNGQHAALVELDAFEKAQPGVPSKAPAARGEPCLLRGLIRCSACGRGYYRAHRGSRRRPYYAGNARRAADCGCKMHRIPSEVLEDFVVDHIRTCIDDGLADEVLLGLGQRVDAERRVLARQRATLEQQVTQAERETREVAAALTHAENAASRAILQARLDALAVQHADARLALCTLDTQGAKVDALRVDGQWI
ncbi:MAG: recombinase family protein, partial [Myxococcales bacterium]|nr:recombinase family protein [Myxococcales bacterium]